MNQSLPYQATALGADGYRSLSVSFPRSALSQRDSRIGPFYKLRVDDGSPRGAMLASYMDHLFKGLDGWSPAEAAELGAVSYTHLVRASCGGQPAGQELDLGALQAGDRHTVFLLPSAQGPRLLHAADQTAR